MLSQITAYKPEITTTDKCALYYGTSDRGFKTRFKNHTRSFRQKRYSIDTELSKYIWKLSNDKIKWKVAAYASSYKCGSRRYDLCLTEKLKIMRKDPELC